MLHWIVPAWLLASTQRYRWLCGYLFLFGAWIFRRYRHRWHYNTEVQQQLNRVREEQAKVGQSSIAPLEGGGESSPNANANQQPSEQISTDRNGRKIIIGFRGAGTYAYYYVGACEVLQVMLKRDSLGQLGFEGISSGALMATLMALNVDITRVFEHFEEMVERKRARLAAQWFGLGRFLYPWPEARARVQVVEEYIQRNVSDEQARALSGRLTIAVYDVLRARPVANSQWRSVKHLLSWLLASMSIPFVTGLPRWISSPGDVRPDTQQQVPSRRRNKALKKWHWAMDVLNWDILAWRKSPAVKRINISVLDVASTIHPDVELPLLLAILRQSTEMRWFLHERGRQNMRSYIESHRDLLAAHLRAAAPADVPKAAEVAASPADIEQSGGEQEEEMHHRSVRLRTRNSGDDAKARIVPLSAMMVARPLQIVSNGVPNSTNADHATSNTSWPLRHPLAPLGATIALASIAMPPSPLSLPLPSLSSASESLRRHTSWVNESLDTAHELATAADAYSGDGDAVWHSATEAEAEAILSTVPDSSADLMMEVGLPMPMEEVLA